MYVAYDIFSVSRTKLEFGLCEITNLFMHTSICVSSDTDYLTFLMVTDDTRLVYTSLIIGRWEVTEIPVVSVGLLGSVSENVHAL
jgi:hypothetical protein